jgi:hypothetical protein
MDSHIEAFSSDPNREDLENIIPGRLFFKEMMLTGIATIHQRSKYILWVVSVLHSLLPFITRLVLDI